MKSKQAHKIPRGIGEIEGYIKNPTPTKFVDLVETAACALHMAKGPSSRDSYASSVLQVRAALRAIGVVPPETIGMTKPQ